MRIKTVGKVIVVLAAFFGALVSPVWSQAATTAPDKPLTGSFGAGFSKTGGNTDTANYNLSFDVTHDPKTKNIMKFEGIFLRGLENNQTIASRLRLGFQDQYTMSDRTFLFGEVNYLRDPFKEIDYLINPNGGVGYKVVATEVMDFSVSGGLGAVWERNTGLLTDSSGSVNAGQKLQVRLSETASISQTVSALWKMQNFDDALYHFGVALATAITKRAELKVEFLDEFKNVTPDPTVKKNDTAFLTTFLFRF